MRIGKGEFVAVVGPSGCGKSTLMKLVTGLLPATAGEIVVHGQKVTRPIKGVGMAFQNSNLLPWRNATENVLLPLEIVQPYRSDFSKSKYAPRAKALLESVGLQGFTEKFPWQLSGGMQQRTSICRALIHEPEILMLDEPFGALDAFTREELWCALRDLQAARKVTVMLVTHDLREAVFLADTVYVMSSRPGRIVRRRVVKLARPRDLEVTYTQGFQDIVHELRTLIGKH
jgi:NitT/TauT family transport system ATP-binding protein